MNVSIEIRNIIVDMYIRAEEVSIIISMLALFLRLASSALTTPTTKRYLELKYRELNAKASNGVKIDETEKITTQKLKEVVENYWVMAETGSPQFVMARSVTTSISGIICLLSALTLVEAVIRVIFLTENPTDIIAKSKSKSNYQWSTSWILRIQFIGLMVGTVAPTFRWFILISLNFSEGDRSNNHKESKLVENYWIQRLVEWKERPLAVQIRSLKCKRSAHFTRNLILDLCIGIQFGIAVARKAVRFISVTSVSPLVSFCYYCKTLKRSLLSESHAPS